MALCQFCRRFINQNPKPNDCAGHVEIYLKKKNFAEILLQFMAMLISNSFAMPLLQSMYTEWFTESINLKVL